MESPDAECDGAVTVAYPSQNPGLTEVVAHCFPPGTLDRMYSPYPVRIDPALLPLDVPYAVSGVRLVPLEALKELEAEELAPDAD